MAQQAWRKIRMLVSGIIVGVSVLTTAIDRLASVTLVTGRSMQPSLNPEGGSNCDVVLLNKWSVRNYEVQRGDVVTVMSPKNPQDEIIKRVIGLEGDLIRTLGYKNRLVRVPDGHFWLEGDHHGSSMDSNSYGPVSVGLLQSRASHIIWPPHRLQRIAASLPPNRGPLDDEEEEG
ncbi:mitochondrial inner membrane protease subunit 2 [Trematomus bernacchii]|uniref:mitochondrial inner membrane protease subunit 2 n=1 Tax=Trematomus bernacchii TaxID=40690 RepID=UPI00146B8BF4|nr:mitochondrial inner membrane protease subunit 2 [Trematomus bernacchii]XP_033982885.1 mitochondrial inner membrane protease subunit 2 [Trematomus bernacchii]XP_033982886.1 mitochondrial inner membrane protease subunit 2 [Trematomus bernacchii]